MEMKRLVIAAASVASCICGAQVHAQVSAAVAEPVVAVGDRWEWIANVSPLDSCSQGLQNGARVIETVTQVSDAGYATEVTGPGPNTRYTRHYAKDLSYGVKVKGETARFNPIKFPLSSSNNWETTVANGNVVTELKCQQDAMEQMKVGNEELNVAPISCNGNWNNLSSRNSGGATYKYWYSPVVGNFVRRSVSTLNFGRTCSKFEFVLESYTRAK